MPRTLARSSSGGAGSRDLLAQHLRYRWRWLLFFRHCAKCSTPGACEHGHQCADGHALLQHMTRCRDSSTCGVATCAMLKDLLLHHRECRAPNCATCMPVKVYVARARLPKKASANDGPSPDTCHIPAAILGGPHERHLAHDSSGSDEPSANSGNHLAAAAAAAAAKAARSSAAPMSRLAITSSARSPQHGAFHNMEAEVADEAVPVSPPPMMAEEEGESFVPPEAASPVQQPCVLYE